MHWPLGRPTLFTTLSCRRNLAPGSQGRRYRQRSLASLNHLPITNEFPSRKSQPRRLLILPTNKSSHRYGFFTRTDKTAFPRQYAADERTGSINGYSRHSSLISCFSLICTGVFPLATCIVIYTPCWHALGQSLFLRVLCRSLRFHLHAVRHPLFISPDRIEGGKAVNRDFKTSTPLIEFPTTQPRVVQQLLPRIRYQGRDSRAAFDKLLFRCVEQDFIRRSFVPYKGLLRPKSYERGERTVWSLCNSQTNFLLERYCYSSNSSGVMGYEAYKAGRRA